MSHTPDVLHRLWQDPPDPNFVPWSMSDQCSLRCNYWNLNRGRNGEWRPESHPPFQSGIGWDFNFKGACRCEGDMCDVCVCAASHFLDCDTIQESVNNQHAGWHILHDFMMHGMEMLIGDSGHEGEKKKKKERATANMTCISMLFEIWESYVQCILSNGSNGREPRVFH